MSYTKSVFYLGSSVVLTYGLYLVVESTKTGQKELKSPGANDKNKLIQGTLSGQGASSLSQLKKNTDKKRKELAEQYAQKLYDETVQKQELEKKK